MVVSGYSRAPNRELELVDLVAPPDADGFPVLVPKPTHPASLSTLAGPDPLAVSIDLAGTPARVRVFEFKPAPASTRARSASSCSRPPSSSPTRRSSSCFDWPGDYLVELSAPHVRTAKHLVDVTAWPGQEAAP